MSDVQPSSSSAIVHGVIVGELSPIKASRKSNEIKYFEGKLSDGIKTVRVVSFDPKLHTQFEEVKKSGRSVALQNCFVKRSRFETDNFEIHVNNKSSIVSSPKKFKVSEDALTTSCCPELGTIEELKDLTEHQQLNVTGKIQSISVVEQLVKKGTGKQLSKQDFVELINRRLPCARPH